MQAKISFIGTDNEKFLSEVNLRLLKFEEAALLSTRNVFEELRMTSDDFTEEHKKALDIVRNAFHDVKCYEISKSALSILPDLPETLDVLYFITFNYLGNSLR